MPSESVYSDLSTPYPYQCQTTASVCAPPEKLFDFLDDHTRLSAHMSKSSWMMGGGAMQIEFDAARGQKIGSWIRLSGRILGVTLFVEEVVTERTPPRRKVWETTGASRLLVIGRYRMGFDIAPQEIGSQLTIFIDYALPDGAAAHWLGYLVGGYYARWCTERMVADAVRHFGHQDNDRKKKRCDEKFFDGIVDKRRIRDRAKKDLGGRSLEDV